MGNKVCRDLGPVTWDLGLSRRLGRPYGVLWRTDVTSLHPACQLTNSNCTLTTGHFRREEESDGDMIYVDTLHKSVGNVWKQTYTNPDTGRLEVDSPGRIQEALDDGVRWRRTLLAISHTLFGAHIQRLHRECVRTTTPYLLRICVHGSVRIYESVCAS